MATIYCSVDEVKAVVDVKNPAQDAEIARAVTAASRMAESYTGRRFYLDDTSSARVYWPDRYRTCRVCTDDFSTLVSVKSDAGDDGAYETTYTNYQTYPLNGLAAGLPWAYESIDLTDGQTFPIGTYKPPVQVTATWGWASVPDAVKQATIVQAIRLWKGQLAPFGVLEVADVTVARLPQVHPEVAALLAPYRKRPVLVA